MAKKALKSNGITPAAKGFHESRQKQWKSLEDIATVLNIQDIQTTIEQWMNTPEVIKILIFQEWLWGNTAMNDVSVKELKQGLAFRSKPFTISEWISDYKAQRMRIVSNKIEILDDVAEIFEHFVKDKSNLKETFFNQVTKYLDSFKEYVDKNSLLEANEKNMYIIIEEQRANGINFTYAFF